MKLIFLSNYYNHHQASFCNALSSHVGVSFQFIACGKMREERLKMWGELQDFPSFIVTPKTQEDWSRVSNEVLSADALIVGSAPQFLLDERLKAGKLILRYQERPLKNGVEPLKLLPRMLKWRRMSPPSKPVYLLCASAYTAGDYAKMVNVLSLKRSRAVFSGQGAFWIGSTLMTLSESQLDCVTMGIALSYALQAQALLKISFVI